MKCFFFKKIFSQLSFICVCKILLGLNQDDYAVMLKANVKLEMLRFIAKSLYQSLL